jgi:hypothetical protein
MASLRAEIDAILEVARRNNRRSGITGGLFVTGDIAAQLLEGPSAAVKTIFDKIHVDLRHSDVTVLRRRDVPRRIFPTWAMGFEITAEATDDIWGLLARAFVIQNDDVADGVTDLIKDGGIRVDM